MENKTSFYYDFNYSLPLVQMIMKLLGKGDDPDQTQMTADANREWFSQPRPGESPETECVTVAFRLPLSVSEISTEVLRMPCNAELWYQDRSNNWRPILDMQRIPLKARVSRSDTKGWFKWYNKCYPIVAKKVQVRLTRYYDPALEGTDFPVGLRNTLIRRNVYERSQGGFFEDEIDVMGNVVSKYVRDWDASKATDDNYTTFWKSGPQPDPAAVVSMYLDVRAEDGGPQVIDKLYIDPVYANQHLNLYYSSDAAVGTRSLSPITIPPAAGTDAEPTVLNAEWRYGRGLTDTATGTGHSYYTWPLNVGPQSNKDAWIGVEWRPSFAPMNMNLFTGPYNNGADYNPGEIVSYNGNFYARLLGPNPGYPPGTVYWGPALNVPAYNPILFAAGEPTSNTVKPVLSYNPTDRTFALDFFGKNSQGTVFSVGASSVTPAISHAWSAGDSIKVVAGWRKVAGIWNVWIKVVDARGRTIASLDRQKNDLPELISFDGTAKVADFRGSLANLVVKLEPHTESSESFLANPEIYCEPDPVVANDSGRYPATTLDNAIYVAPWLGREHGSGGSSPSHFDAKEWTPIWRDYIAVKGMLRLPQPISMHYLKLEFTNLTEQPYPIYESGIDVKYKVFPFSATQTSSLGPRLYTGEGGFLGLGTFISLNGVRSVNWLDSNSVMQAIGAITATQTPPVVINPGNPYLSDILPNQGVAQVDNARRVEAASSYVYSRDVIQPYVLAQDRYNTIIRAEGLQAIQPYVDVPWTEIEAANPNTITKVKSTGTMPVRGTDWWIYPGQQLKVPASVMLKLTETQTVTERKFTLENRTRFNTTSVHRYDWRTVKRDAAIAYFAGVREVQPYTSTYISGEDTPVYKFPSYTDQHWVFTNARRFTEEVTDNDGTRKVEYSPVTAALPAVAGVISSKELISQSDFSKVTLSFQDSGLAKSNPMWVDIDENTESIDDTQLSPYFGVIPEDIQKSSWNDSLASWGDTVTEWGAPYGLVSINVDNDRRYLGKRVIHFTRAAGAGQAGIKLRQWMNFSPGAQFRIGAVLYRPRSTGNNIILRLKRDDGTTVIEETLGTSRSVITTNVNIRTPGSAVGTTAAASGNLVYLSGQTKSSENGLYRFLGATTALELVPDYVPSGRWYEAVTEFAEIPETISNASFDNNLIGWVPAGGTWTAVSDKGYTGLKSAKLTTNGTLSTLTSGGIECLLGSTVEASAWVTWSGLTTTGGGRIRLRAVFYNSSNAQVGTADMNGSTQPATAATTSWVPLSGSATIPTGLGVTRVAFQVVVEASLGTGGSVWVDDFTGDVPGSPRQQYVAELTIEGDEEEELYVSELYTETTPIRYFVRLGPPGTESIEVTDLRYTKTQAIVTATEPVKQMQVQAVITSNRSYAFGCTITPHYLK